MSDRKNFGYGLLVTDTHLDEAFDDLENAIRDLSDDTGLAQAATTDSPDSNVYGGILSGLTITRNGTNDYITIAAGVAYDDSGRRIQLPSAATLKITKTGATTEGDVTDALGDGSLVTASVGASQYAVMSIFIVYDENQSDQKTDGLGSTYYFEETESFHFYIKIGTAFTLPLGGAPTRGALENGKVLLADLVIYNNAGSIQVRQDGGVDAVLYSNENFDDYSGGIGDANIATLTGRRSDWLALDNVTDLPLFDAQSTELRANSAREALRDTWMMLQKSSSQPAGGDLVGVAVHNAVAGTGIAAPASVTVAAGSLHTKLNTICSYLADCLYKGGDNIITTLDADKNGLKIYNAYDTNQKYMLNLQKEVNKPALWIGNYGEIVRGKVIDEHWIYQNGGVGPYSFPTLEKWTEVGSTSGGGGSTILNGTLLIDVNAATGDPGYQGVALCDESSTFFTFGYGNAYGVGNANKIYPNFFGNFSFTANGNGLADTTCYIECGFYQDINNYIVVIFSQTGADGSIFLKLNGGGTTETETLLPSTDHISLVDTDLTFSVHFSGFPNGSDDGASGYVTVIDKATNTFTKKTTQATASAIQLASGKYGFYVKGYATQSDGTYKGIIMTCHHLYLAETSNHLISTT